jgi:hypothetical protein
LAGPRISPDDESPTGQKMSPSSRTCWAWNASRSTDRLAASRTRSPVFLWHGELDRNVPVVAGRHLASAIPNCRATFYPQDAHLSVPFNHLEEIFRVLATAR